MISPIVILAPLLALNSFFKGEGDGEEHITADTLRHDLEPSCLDRVPGWLTALLPFISAWLMLALGWWFCYSAYELRETTLRCSHQIDSARKAYKKAIWEIDHPIADTMRFTDFCLSLPIRGQKPADDDVSVPMTIPKVTNDKKIP